MVSNGVIESGSQGSWSICTIPCSSLGSSPTEHYGKWMLLPFENDRRILCIFHASKYRRVSSPAPLEHQSIWADSIGKGHQCSIWRFPMKSPFLLIKSMKTKIKAISRWFSKPSLLCAGRFFDCGGQKNRLANLSGWQGELSGDWKNVDSGWLKMLSPMISTDSHPQIDEKDWKSSHPYEFHGDLLHLFGDDSDYKLILQMIPMVDLLQRGWCSVAMVGLTWNCAYPHSWMVYNRESHEN